MMKRLTLLLGLTAITLAACGAAATEPPTPSPTFIPSPTAVPLQINPQAQLGDASWAISFEIRFPPNTWAPGWHRYAFVTLCPLVYASEEPINSEWVNFRSDEGQPVRDGPVYLRLRGLSTDPLSLDQEFAVEHIHPDQETVAMLTLAGINQETAEAAAGECEIIFGRDQFPAQVLIPGEPFQFDNP